MIQVRPSDERGHFNHGWLNTFHTFSFADYYDPKHVHFKTLRVLNEDYVAPERGFGTHPHRDMEIITYVLDGEIAHKDSMGNGSTIRRGDVQRMTAGTGVMHSEFNPGKDPLHLLQIWILPERHGLTPGYEQKNFPDSDKLGKLKLIASNDGREGSVQINQDVNLFAAILQQNASINHEFGSGRSGWLQVITGTVEANGVKLSAGDGAALSNESQLALRALNGSAEFLLFDLA